MKNLTPRKALRWGCITGAGLLLFVVLLAGLLLAPIWDIAPVDDSDMRFERVELLEDENAWPLFRKAHASLRLFKPESEIWSDWEKSPEEHADAIRRWFREFPEIHTLIREGLDRGAYRTPEIRRYADEVPWTLEDLELGRWYAIRSRTEPDEFLRRMWLKEHFHFAALCHSAGDTMIEAMSARGVLQSATRSLLDDLYEDRFSHESIRLLLEALPVFGLETERMIRSFQSEYLAATQALDVDLPKVGLYGIHNEKKATAFWLMLLHRPHSWTFQPNRTKLLVLESLRDAVAVIRGEAELHTLTNDIDPRRFLRDRSIRSYLRFSQNGVGKIFTQMILPASQGFITSHRNQQAQLHALRIICALRLYHHQTGALPDTLEQLVPDFFDSVPLDPFDGQPFRYLPESARIYSVGQDGIDQGGSTRFRDPRRRKRSAFQHEDLVFGIFERIPQD